MAAKTEKICTECRRPYMGSAAAKHQIRCPECAVIANRRQEREYSASLRRARICRDCGLSFAPVTPQTLYCPSCQPRHYKPAQYMAVMRAAMAEREREMAIADAANAGRIWRNDGGGVMPTGLATVIQRG